MGFTHDKQKFLVEVIVGVRVSRETVRLWRWEPGTQIG